MMRRLSLKISLVAGSVQEMLSRRVTFTATLATAERSAGDDDDDDDDNDDDDDHLLQDGAEKELLKEIELISGVQVRGRSRGITAEAFSL